MVKIINCQNLATGHFYMVPGKFSINTDLEDTIRVLLSEKDLTGTVKGDPSNYKFDFNTITFVERDTPYLNVEDEHAIFQPDLGRIFIAPEIIAECVADLWVANRLYNVNYAVNGTIVLLTAIQHEVTHSRVHPHYNVHSPDETSKARIAREEADVVKYSDAQIKAFMQKYTLSFETLELMHRLISDALLKYPVGIDIIQKQSSWAANSIASVDRHGTITLSVREEYRRQFDRWSEWHNNSMSIKEGVSLFEEERLYALAEAAEEAKLATKEKVEVAEAEVVVAEVKAAVPPPPPVVTPAVTRATPPPPPPPVTVSVAVPPPPPASRPEPPIEAYEEYNWLAAEANLMKKAGMSVEVPPTKPMTTADHIATAIKKSTTYNSVPTKVCRDTELAIKKVGYAIFCHIFEECGWDVESETGFTNSEAVTKELDLTHIAGIDKFVVSYFALDAMGTFTSFPFTGHIRGGLFSKTKLPNYSVVFRDGDVLTTRNFIPQNINKMKDEKKQLLSDGAKWCRATSKGLMWVLDPGVTNHAVDAARDKKEPGTKFMGKYEDYNYLPIKTREVPCTKNSKA